MSNNLDIYVINLDKDTERLTQITRRLSPNFFTRIPGVYGNDINPTEHSEILFTSKYLLPRSAIGCALSHRKAIQTFLDTSNKPYGLIIEDDAEPLSKYFMEETMDAIKNAPTDWNIIKLDYNPKYNVPHYHRLFSTATTAYIINKAGAEKFLRQPVVYHIDVDMNFYDLKMYNNPNIVFEQQWGKENNSNNRKYSLYNPFTYIHDGINYKILRILGSEYTVADLVLFLFVIALIIIIWVYRLDKYIIAILFRGRGFSKSTVK
jgi:GR25 family glycosyltransferase involved in LPS biosynthesis